MGIGNENRYSATSKGSLLTRSLRSRGWKSSNRMLLAWNSEGHQYLTDEAIKAALKKLPPKLSWIRNFIRGSSTSAVYIDVEDVFTRGHWKVSGQRHHFMRFGNQSQLEAYKAGVAYILDHSKKAAENLRRVWKEQLGHYNPLFVNEPMGLALHALQDSFAGGHAIRKKLGEKWVITDIQVYDEKNKEPRKDWPGHKALDKQWKNTPLGNEAITAGRELVRIVVHSSLSRSEKLFRHDWGDLWSAFANMFLATTITASKKDQDKDKGSLRVPIRTRI